MSILRNEFYQGETDPNLLSGLTYAVREKLDDKHIIHDQHASRLNYAPKFPYTEAIIRQGGKPTPDQFFGLEKPSDAWVNELLKRQHILNQKKVIEERDYPVHSRADLDRVYKAHFQQLFQKQLLDRDVQYNAQLLSAFKGSANDPNRPELSEKDAYLEREGQRTRYMAEGSLMQSPSMQQFLAKEMATAQFFGNRMPVTGATPTPPLAVAGTSGAGALTAPVAGTSGAGALTAPVDAASSAESGLTSMPSAVASADARDRALGIEAPPTDMLIATEEQERKITTLLRGWKTLDDEGLAKIVGELDDESFPWATYIDLKTAGLESEDSAVISHQIQKRVDYAIRERSKLTEAGVPLGEEARAIDVDEGAPIGLAESGMHGALEADDVAEAREEAETARDTAEEEAIRGRPEREDDGDDDPAVGEKGARGGTEYPTYANTRQSTKVTEPFITEDGKHFLKPGKNGDYNASEKVRIGGETKHRGLWGVVQEAMREGKDVTGLAWIPEFIPGPDGKTLAPSKPRSAAAKAGTRPIYEFGTVKKGGAGSSGSK